MVLNRFLDSSDYLLYYALEKYKVINMVMGSNGFINVDYDPKKLPSYIAGNDKVEKAYCISAYCLGKAIAKGEKVFSLTGEQLEALEHTTLSIGFDDYVQPYDTMVIEFPKNYQQNRIKKYKDDYEIFPVFVIVHHEKTTKSIIMALAMQGEDKKRIDFVTMTLAYDTITIEQAINRAVNRGLVNQTPSGWVPSGELTESQTESELGDILRAALNTCLIFDEYGCKIVQSSTSTKIGKYLKHVDVARKSGDQKKIDRAEAEQKGLARKYGFKQEVVLFKKEVEERVKGDPGDGEVCIHWRRGHYRMQAHGPGSGLRKRIRIAAVLVNAKKYVGELKDTETTYRSK